MRVATWKFPDPVALVKVRPVEETVVAVKVVAERLVPVAFTKVRAVEDTRFVVRVPVADTENWVELFTWRFRKSPVKATGFEPM